MKIVRDMPQPIHFKIDIQLQMMLCTLLVVPLQCDSCGTWTMQLFVCAKKKICHVVPIRGM